MNADTVFLFLVVFVAVISVMKAVKAEKRRSLTEREKLDLIERFEYEKDEERKRRTFGLQKARDIYLAAKGKFDSEGDKAVPFAILATANALGAYVRIKGEGQEEIIKINEHTLEVVGRNEGLIKSSEERISNLFKEIETEKRSISINKKTIEETVTKNEEAIKGTQAILDFFTV
jgi:hypothetical protein